MLRDGLVLDLPLREKDGDAFMSNDVYGHRCINHGSNWNMEGHTFDGIDDYVNCGNDPSLAIRTGSWTFSAYIKTSTIFANTDRGTVLWRGTGAGAGSIDLNLGQSDSNSLTCTIRDNATWAKTVSANALNDGLWHNIVLVRDVSDGKLYLYIDDLTRVEANDPTGDINPLNDLYIGWRNGGTYYFNGSIDEIRIYNQALSENEIVDYYNTTKKYYL